MQIQLNGKSVEIESATALKHLIERHCSGSLRIIAEVNGEIINPSHWSDTAINAGDTIELLNFVGGGAKG